MSRRDSTARRESLTRRDSIQMDFLAVSPSVSRRGSLLRSSFDGLLQIPGDRGRRRSSM